MILRPATPDDAEALARIEFAVAHHAFADLEPRRVAFLDLDDLIGEWRQRLDPPDLMMGECLAVVAELGDRAVGVAAWLVPTGPRRLPVASGSLDHLLVHPAAQNAGVGSALLPAAEDALRALRGDHDRQTGHLHLHDDAWWAARFLGARGWVRDADPPADVLPWAGWSKAL